MTRRSFRHLCLHDRLEILPQPVANLTVGLRVSLIMTSLATTGLKHGAASSVKYASLSPNPLREKSKGRMVHAVPLIVFMDDVSGNISKQWNKHHAIYMSNANLPREMLEKEFFMRFVSSSPHAPPMELMRAMKESISYVILLIVYILV